MLVFKILGKRAIWQFDIPFQHVNSTKHLDLGCGGNPRNPFKAKEVIGLDVNIRSEEKTNYEKTYQDCIVKYVHADATLNLPFPSDYFDSISAFDFLEHIPRWERRGSAIHFPFVEIMSEIHRTLKPGGHLIALTPGFPNPAVFSDPTHVNFITTETAKYFSIQIDGEPAGIMYGFKGKYEILHNDWLRGGGPNLVNSLQQEYAETTNAMRKVTLSAKAIKRSIQSLFHRKPTHIYWVLQKPSRQLGRV